MLARDEVEKLHGELIRIHYVGGCENFYGDEVAPYYGRYEKYIRDEDGQLSQVHLPLSHYGKHWVAYKVGTETVVRCKDCKFSGMYVFGAGEYEHLACLDIEEDGFVVFAKSVNPDDYCSRAERRNE